MNMHRYNYLCTGIQDGEVFTAILLARDVREAIKHLDTILSDANIHEVTKHSPKHYTRTTAPLLLFIRSKTLYLTRIQKQYYAITLGKYVNKSISKKKWKQTLRVSLP